MKNRQWSFEYQWKNYDTEDLTYGLSAKAEFDKFCNDLDIGPDDMCGKTVLDAGCGSGRLTKNIAGFTDFAYGVDLIPFRSHPEFFFVQANIAKLPFKDGFFDYIYCEGVLHHTPDPKRAFMELARVNKHKIFVMLYAKRNPIMIMRKYLRTYSYPYWLTKYLSRLLAFTFYTPTRFFMSLSHLDRKITVRSLEFMIFDYLSPEHQTVHTFEEVEPWFEEAGYSKVTHIGKQGIAVLGIKRSTDFRSRRYTGVRET
jgi:ubiquinone/menaquinone biosynthesis C-methylase UbiE